MEDNQQILEAIKAGKDDKALNSLYTEIYPKIESFILKNGGDTEEAADIFQDAVLIFYKQVKQGKFKEENPIAGFVFTVSRNLWYNRVKKKNRNNDLTEYEYNIAEDRDVEEDLLTEEREKKINELLSHMEEKCKNILIDSIFNKLSMQEISDKMGFTSSDVAKTKNYKCKKKLIKVLQNNPEFKNLIFNNDG